MEKKSLWLKILPFLCIAIAGVLMSVALSALVINRVTTETVVEKTEQETVATKIFVVRDEQYLDIKNSETIVPLIDDGSKVAKGDTVAAVFENASDALVYAEMMKTQNEINRYKQLVKQVNLDKLNTITLDINKMNSDADLLFIKMLNVASSGKFENFDSSSADFCSKITSRQIVIDHKELDKDKNYFSDKIKSLDIKYSNLEKKNIDFNNLIANESGYYVSRIDGYENNDLFNNIEHVTAAEIESKINSVPNFPKEDAIGKLIVNYNWYILASIESSVAARMNIGQPVTINFGQSFENTVFVKVHSISPSQNGKSAVVFECNLMNDKIAGMRIEEARIVLKEYKGYKVSKAALRVHNGYTGVYVLIGNRAAFREVDVSYSGDDFVIAYIVNNIFGSKKPMQIELYDEVIVKGKNIYDGKIIN